VKKLRKFQYQVKKLLKIVYFNTPMGAINYEQQKKLRIQRVISYTVYKSSKFIKLAKFVIKILVKIENLRLRILVQLALFT